MSSGTNTIRKLNLQKKGPPKDLLPTTESPTDNGHIALSVLGVSTKH